MLLCKNNIQILVQSVISFGLWVGKIILILIKNVNLEQKVMIYLILFTKKIRCKVIAKMLMLYFHRISNLRVIQVNTCVLNTVKKIIDHMIDQISLKDSKMTKALVMLQILLKLYAIKILKSLVVLLLLFIIQFV